MQPGYSEIFHQYRKALAKLYDAGEAAAITREVLQSITGITYGQSLTQRGPLPEPLISTLEILLKKLLSGMPMQYALGYCYFLNRRFVVDNHVLIPRPETEELVNWIIEDYNARKNIKIIDIGTGSGCIAVSIQCAMPDAVVTALDISDGALQIAMKNAEAHGATVRFMQFDFLDKTIWHTVEQYDVIVSNPPYIPVAEEQSLHINVCKWEPHTALFVPDGDPLLFYRNLAVFAGSHLVNGGCIFCELHADFSQAATALFKSHGFQNITLRKDMDGKARMLRASRK